MILDKIDDILDKLVFVTAFVTVCKRIFLIIKRIILIFVSDIRAELYLDSYVIVILPKRI